MWYSSFYYFSSLPSLFFDFFDFDLDIVCVILSSCGYYAVSSVSVSAATGLAYDILVYVSWYARNKLISPFVFVWGTSTRFVSVIVCIIFCLYLFSFCGNFPLQSYWSLSCDRGLHCSDEIMWEQQQQGGVVSPQEWKNQHNTLQKLKENNKLIATRYASLIPGK